MRTKRQITEKTILLTAIIGSLLVVALIAFNSIWNSHHSLAVTEEAVSAVSSFYLDIMAGQRAKTVTNQVDVNFSQMEKAMALLQDAEIESQDDLRANIGIIEDLLSLERFAVADEDNVVYTRYTTYTGRSRHEFLAQEEMPSRYIETVYLYDSSMQLLLAVPSQNLTIMGKRIKACFVQIDMNEIMTLLQPDEKDQTYYALYTKGGLNLLGTELGPVIANKNILVALEGLVPAETCRQTAFDFADEREGTLSFTSGGVEETLCYVPIDGPDWVLVVSVREGVITDQFRSVSENSLVDSQRQIAFTLAAVAVLVTVLVFETRKLHKQRLEVEKARQRSLQTMANTDTLTGLKNRHAYFDCEAALDQKIGDGELRELAVVVCDINGLKYVNDTQGHAAGDQLIRDASDLINTYFKQDTIFRIGGDEFVVLLQGAGYKNLHVTMAAFNARAEANIHVNDVVIAAGFAIFESGDSKFKDIFDRADKRMYERKKVLKSMGAKARD